MNKLKKITLFSFLFMFSSLKSFALDNCTDSNPICSNVANNQISFKNQTKNVYSCVVTLITNNKRNSKPIIIAIKPGQTEKLNINKNSSWGYYYYFTSGFVLPYETTDYPYKLPFSAGKIMRTAPHPPAHKGISKYAIDFPMPENTPIYASRGGIVTAVKQDSNIGGFDPAFAKDGNYIEVAHNDGTLALYVHLKKDGAKVKVMQNIKEGQLLGYSGNTGYSSDPHLHFHVYRPNIYDDGTKFIIQYEGIHFKYKSSSGIEFPVPGQSYMSSGSIQIAH